MSDPEELLERETLDIEHAARVLRLPASELCAARGEHVGVPAADSNN